MNINWIQIASLLMFAAVGLGAFGAHAIKGKITDTYLDVYKTAVLYHFIHALGIFIVAWLSTTNQDPKISCAGIAFILGITLFSGSLYLLSVTGLKWLGAITPLGGLSFLAGWLFIFLSATQGK